MQAVVLKEERAREERDLASALANDEAKELAKKAIIETSDHMASEKLQKIIQEGKETK
jgi:hypothetical protein